MLSFYIFKNSTFNPNILIVSTIDKMNETHTNSLIDDIVLALLEHNYISLKNNIIFCIIDRKNEEKTYFINQGSDSIMLDSEKLDLNYLEKFSFNIITNYKSSYILEYNKEKLEIILKEKQDNIDFLGNLW